MELLERRLGYHFHQRSLLVEALTHPSHACDPKRRGRDNQRLEFLGDAVLQLVLTEHLFRRFRKSPEGQLTKLRSRLVSRKALADFARQLDLGTFILLGKGEQMTGGRERHSTLADAYEALIGAVYLDAGYERTRDLVLGLMDEAILRLAEDPEDERNPKGKLQECLQSIEPSAPCYEIVEASGPDHCRVFTARVLWQGRELSRGQGTTKKEAEARAAEEALRARIWESG